MVMMDCSLVYVPCGSKRFSETPSITPILLTSEMKGTAHSAASFWSEYSRASEVLAISSTSAVFDSSFAASCRVIAASGSKIPSPRPSTTPRRLSA